jgi:hypothetical protein
MGHPHVNSDVYLPPDQLPRLVRLGDRLLPEIDLRTWIVASAAVHLAGQAVTLEPDRQQGMARFLCEWADVVLGAMEGR